MPALVAHPETSPYYASMARTSYKRYETRNSPSAPQVESDHRPKFINSTTPGLVNENSKDPTMKTPVAVEETQEAKSFEPISVIAAAAPMSEDPPRDQLTPNVRKIMRYLTGPNLPTGRKEFAGVQGREFELIQHAVGEKDQVLNKPRLTYDYNALLLTIDMPSTLHEEPFDYLKECLTLAIASPPYDRDLICPRIHMNYQLQLEDKSVTPDMTITLTSVDGPTEDVLISGLGECALSEDRDHVFDKMETEISAHPETILAVIVLIHEAITYKSPSKKSTAFTALRNGDEEEPLPITLKSFIKQRSTPRSFDHPVTVADHQWCQVGSVEYFLWLKNGNAPIDIRSVVPGTMAYGRLVPESDMGAITAMLEGGLMKMRDNMVDFSRQLYPDSDYSELAEATAVLPINWRLAAKGILRAIDVTAHQRYQTWHGTAFRGTKRNRDETYCPSEADLEEGSSKLSDDVHKALGKGANKRLKA